jgi:hypothetical protein
MIIKAVATARPLTSPPAVVWVVLRTSPTSLRTIVFVIVWPDPEIRPRMMAIGMINNRRKSVVSRSRCSG